LLLSRLKINSSRICIGSELLALWSLLFPESCMLYLPFSKFEILKINLTETLNRVNYELEISECYP
jgi:hypothetical protein